MVRTLMNHRVTPTTLLLSLGMLFVLSACPVDPEQGAQSGQGMAGPGGGGPGGGVAGGGGPGGPRSRGRNLTGRQPERRR